MNTLPIDVTAFRKTDVFDRNSIPAGLLKDHNLKSGVWGVINILKGKLVLEFLDDGKIEVLSADRPGVVPPSRMHQIRALEDVNFYVEFWK
ncbi:MAG: DUF1971 domain-containing protein [Gammaproteobacteria bacterium]|nr:DUF1971 domain-containing protein [Gammaproteobacteria bacterium]